MESSARFNGTVDFSNNFGSIYGYTSNLNFNGTMIFRSNSAENSEENEGGVITAFHALLKFNNGSFLFKHNIASNGGTIHMTGGDIYVEGCEIHI